jgi:hypothetical protein
VSTQSGQTVTSAAIAAGFSGDALLTIVAIGHRESGWDDTAQGDISIQDGTWGPSVGVWQIRTMHAQDHTGGDRDFYALIPGGTPGSPGSGQGDIMRQAAAAWTISSGGANFQPWSTFRGLPQADKDAAQAAIGGMSVTDIENAQQGKITHGASSGGPGGLAGAIDSGLGAVLGYSGTFTEWVAMVVIRGLEVVGGGLILGVGLVVFLDVISSGGAGQAARGGAQGAGIVARSIKGGVQLAKLAVAA